ncbi:MAG: 50S ribosomal protein L1 [Candidatus Lokiarchaeota archaeon]|nr:50S ribosomal protein L1 [Candidatus Lokiarchaeota archaeon]MBD3341436.1 50S ribosomal protein L1 [Candidatus Lokiarchaeota archaeon]
MKVDDKLLKQSLNAAIELSVWKKEGQKDKVRNFDETIDLIINIKDINLNDPKQRIDKELILPHEIIKKKPDICVIATEEIYLEAKNMNLDAYNDEDLEDLNRQDKKEKKKFVRSFRYFIVEDKLMPMIARYLARFLGPRGKMPKPFPSGYGIISSVEDLQTAVDRYKRIIRIQVKKNPIVQVRVGKKSMDMDKVYENIKTVVDYVAEQMPHRYNNFKNMYLKTTMGKPVKIDEDFLKQLKVK